MSAGRIGPTPCDAQKRTDDLCQVLRARVSRHDELASVATFLNWLVGHLFANALYSSRRTITIRVAIEAWGVV